MLAKAHELVARCRKAGLTLCTAESCTGGLVAAAITAVPGSSEVFLGALVTYDERIKQAWLSVSEAILEIDGAVSEACARQMARAARKESGADLAISVTGFAGPGGGTKDAPVGTVCFAVDSAGGTEVFRRVFSGSRAEVRESAVIEALLLLTSAASRMN